jgi:hypothetical protein
LDPTHLLSLSQNQEIRPTVPKRGSAAVRGLSRAHRQVAVLGNRVRAATLDARPGPIYFMALIATYSIADEQFSPSLASHVNE